MMLNSRPRVGQREILAPAKPPKSAWLTLLLFLALLASSGVGANLLNGDTGENYRLLRLVSSAIAGLLVLRYAGDLFRIVSKEHWFALFLFWTLSSMIWSESPLDTITTFVGLAAITVISGTLVIRFGAIRSAELLTWTFTATSFVSILFVQFLPELGTMVVTHPAAGYKVQANGIFAWNSDLAFAAGIACLLAIQLWFIKRQWRFLVAILICAATVIMADSVATILSVGVAVLLLLVIQFPIIRVVFAAAIVLLVPAIVIGGVAGLFNSMLGSLNRSSDLTGRSSIWEATLRQASERPFAGWGAGVEPDFYHYLGYSVQHAHNGFLQVFFDRGMIGLLFIIAIIVTIFIRAVRGSSDAKFVVPALAMVIVANFANSYLVYATLATLVLIWALFVSGVRADIDEVRPEYRTKSRGLAFA